MIVLLLLLPLPHGPLGNRSFQLCLEREWILINRDPQKSVVRIVQAVVLGAVNA